MKQIKKFQMGKNGLTPEFVGQLKHFFDKSGTEFIKVEILKSCCRDKKEAEKIGLELVDALGKNYTFKLVGYVLSLRKWRKSKRQ